ncbi:hypothetical protein EYF80_053346 [Liparis tanakae]|uniref:Uncharacterized protein n=1 Tax=Liparis tanakae TaxID=230148 RepID=A0A4Z2F6S3_9TELE|nr:hypothetical protein EYF80_053346 [Liparis tanakae]
MTSHSHRDVSPRLGPVNRKERPLTASSSCSGPELHQSASRSPGAPPLGARCPASRSPVPRHVSAAPELR